MHEAERLGMTPQSAVDREEFERLAALVVQRAAEQGIVLRLLGSLAFHLQCPGHAGLQVALGRSYTDLDYAAYSRQTALVEPLFEGLGFTGDAEINVLFSGQRMIFYHRSKSLHVDVFFDRLDYCHEIDLRRRLEIDPLTLSRSDLLLEKMQIVKINEKDIIDTIMLLLEYPWSSDDSSGIDLDRVVGLCARDWGWWRTLTMNLDKVGQLAQSYVQLSPDEKALVGERVGEARARIDAAPKSTGWKLRARIGDRKKWYREIEDS